MSTIKAIIVGALAAVGVGAGVKYATKATMTQTTDNIVKLSDSTVNNDILFQAIQQKNQKYNLYDLDLSVRSNWFELADKLVYDAHQPGYAELVLKDYYAFSQIERGDMRFPEFLDQEKLAQYVTEQDSTETFRTQITDFIHQSIQDDYGINLQDNELSNAKAIASQVREMTDPEQVGDLLDKVNLWQTWKEDIDYHDIFDTYLRYDYSADELTNMPLSEKAEHVIYELDKHQVSHQRSVPGADYSPNGIIEYSKSLSDSDQDLLELAGFITDYRDYSHAKDIANGQGTGVEITDVVSTFGHSPELDVYADPIRESRQDILENAIEDRYDLPDNCINLGYWRQDMPEQVSASDRAELAENLLDSTSYLRNMKEPLSTDMTGAQQIEALGVREQIDAMIANGDTVNLGSTTEPISDAMSFKFGGLGAVVTFVAVLLVYKMRTRKIKKICAENPEAAKKYREYMEENSKK